jgi:hypothetical protein
MGKYGISGKIEDKWENIGQAGKYRISGKI